ncbi:MAG TPA: hypothetical protein VNY05_42130, partial [Candidatus Acidoferrales bacterium]|nr:hypothetical protein [Candidatus Acidoferrales bacterium]
MRLFFAASAMTAMAWAQTPAPAPDAPPDIAKVQAALDRSNRTLRDWPALGRYHDANSQLEPPAAGEERVVFMGDSIT